MTKRISVHEAPQWIALMGKQIRGAAIRGLQSAAIRTVVHIQTEVIPREPRPPVDKGIYRAAWRAEPLPNGALVVNTAPHALFIEHGVEAKNVRPGRKMLEALTEWVRRKGMASSENARHVAYAVMMSLKQRGIFDGGKGLHILGKASKRIPQFIEEEVAREVARMR